MSSIKLPHASGNSVSIAAPQSNPASDRTLYLPSNADGTVLSNTTPGCILQVVQTVDTTGVTTITSTSYVDAGSLSVNITPVSSSNKILIMATTNCQVFRQEDEATAGLRLLRGSSEIIEYPYAFVLEAETSSNSRVFYNLNHPATYLDSPSSTSQLTYKIQLKVYTDANTNRISYNQNTSKSTITAMEVAG